MTDSKIVWDNTVIHPYEFVGWYDIKTAKNNILIAEGLLLQVTERVTECGLHMLKTSEGFYISVDRNVSNTLNFSLTVNTSLISSIGRSVLDTAFNDFAVATRVVSVVD